MEVKPSKGLKVKVNAHREAIFGDESLDIQKITINDGTNLGVMTGSVLAGFGQVDMQKLDGRTHWYPIDELIGEHGEKVVEDEVPVDMTDDGSEDSEEES